MSTERIYSLTPKLSCVAAFCLALGGPFVIGCDRPAASDATTASLSPTPRIESRSTGSSLRADPNPVPVGTPNGKTTITWDTGSDAVGDVYVADAGNERLFASGAKGSQDAPWIPPGSTEFRLYGQSDHKLLAQLTVTMRSSDSISSPSSTLAP